MTQVSESLSELEGEIDDEEFDLLKQWYNEMKSMAEVIDNIPDGKEADYETRLEGYREITKKCNEKLSNKEWCGYSIERFLAYR